MPAIGRTEGASPPWAGRSSGSPSSVVTTGDAGGGGGGALWAAGTVFLPRCATTLARVSRDAAVVREGFFPRRRLRLVAEHHHHAAVQVALRLQPVADEGYVELRLEPEDVGVGGEGDAGAGAARVALLRQPGGGQSLGVLLLVVLAVALDARDQLRAQRVDHRRTPAVQSAGAGVVALLELPARVQRGDDDLQRGFLVLRHHVHGDAAAVVGDGDGLAVLVQGHLDARGVPVDHLVHRVVEDLPEQGVVAAPLGAADIHGGPFADRLEPFEHLDVRGAVGRLAHGHYFFSSGSAWTTGPVEGALRVSRFTSWCPFPPRLTGSWRKVVSSSLRPLVVSSPTTACLSRVQRKAITSSSGPSLMTCTPRPGPASSLISSTLQTSVCADFDATARRSLSCTGTTPSSSSPSPGLAKRRPARVDSSVWGESAKRRP